MKLPLPCRTAILSAALLAAGSIASAADLHIPRVASDAGQPLSPLAAPVRMGSFQPLHGLSSPQFLQGAALAPAPSPLPALAPAAPVKTAAPVVLPVTEPLQPLLAPTAPAPASPDAQPPQMQTPEGLSSDSLAPGYDAAQRPAREQVIHKAQATASRLLDGLRAAPSLPGDSVAAPDDAPLSQPEALPTASYYDSRHWAPEAIPDRKYAGRLREAARLLADSDQAGSAVVASSARAKAGLLDTMREKDAKIHSHMMRVGLLAGLIALKMGLAPSIAQNVAWAGRVHDIGKRDEPIRSVVNKPGKLTPEERLIIEGHPEAGAAIIAAYPGLDAASRGLGVRAALFHHETPDGKGYPRTLSDEKIYLAARITALADIYDALMENRPYRSAMTTEQALKIMEAQKAQYDPAAWQVFLGLLS